MHGPAERTDAGQPARATVDHTRAPQLVRAADTGRQAQLPRPNQPRAMRRRRRLPAEYVAGKVTTGKRRASGSTAGLTNGSNR